jgi:hypothetical protein
MLYRRSAPIELNPANNVETPKPTVISHVLDLQPFLIYIRSAMDLFIGLDVEMRSVIQGQ